MVTPLRSSFLVLAALLMSSGAVAQQNAAPAAARTCTLDSFGFTTDSSFTPAQVCQVYDDLTYLSAMSFSAFGPGFSSMFACSDAAHGGRCVTAWLRSRIRALSVGRVSGASAANLGHAARVGSAGVPATTPPGSIMLTSAFFALSRIGRLSTLVHEARHTDGDRNITWLRDHHVESDPSHPTTNHVPARVARLEGSGAPPGPSDAGVDDSFTDGGAYAYMLVFVDNVEACTNCSQDDRDGLDALERGITMNFRELSEDMLTAGSRPR
jgi:hypothetical protein